MEDNILIRPFAVQDKPKVLELLTEVELSTTDLTDEKLNDFLVMEVPSAGIVGTIGLEAYSKLGLLRSLAVAPSYQGRGLGKKLTNHLEILAQNQRIKRLFLLTTTAEDFFRQLNYSLIDRQEVPGVIKETGEFKDICPVSAVCLTKNIME